MLTLVFLIILFAKVLTERFTTMVGDLFIVTLT